ncbi:MAG: hypothetical protein Q9222_007343 [Ikaeria aurantiellina]
MYPWRLERLTNAFSTEFMMHSKVVDTSQENIVAYAAWQLPHPSKPEDASHENNPGSDRPNPRLPEGTNVKMFGAVYKEQDRLRAKHVDSTQDYILRAIVTHPDYYGRGLATMLLRQGLEKIDAERRRCYLEASPAARPIYDKMGWVVVDHIKTDLAEYGVPGSHFRELHSEVLSLLCFVSSFVKFYKDLVVPERWPQKRSGTIHFRSPTLGDVV